MYKCLERILAHTTRVKILLVSAKIINGKMFFRNQMAALESYKMHFSISLSNIPSGTYTSLYKVTIHFNLNT